FSLGRPRAGYTVSTWSQPIRLRSRSRMDAAFRLAPACASGTPSFRPRTSSDATACRSPRLSAPPSISRVTWPGRRYRGGGQGAAQPADRSGRVSLVPRDASRIDVDLPGQASGRPRRACNRVGHGDTPARAADRRRPSTSASQGCAVRRRGKVSRPYRPLLPRPPAGPGVRREHPSGESGGGQPPPEPPDESGIPPAPLHRVRRLQLAGRHRLPRARSAWLDRAGFRKPAQSKAEITTTLRKATLIVLIHFLMPPGTCGKPPTLFQTDHGW